MKRLRHIALLLIYGLVGHQLLATMVTFQADLSTQPSISPNGVHIMGPFNNWNPATIAMTATGLGRYAITLPFTAGDYIQYKFVNGNAYGSEEAIYGDCAFGTYRYLHVPIADTVLPWVCYGACDSACTPATGTRIACVGNSITYGLGLPNNIHQSYPSVLQDSLGPNYLVANFGAPGAAVIRQAGFPYVLSTLFPLARSFAPETVLFMLGTNDSKSAIWDNFGSAFAADYDSLCMAFDTLPSQPRMVVITPATAFSMISGIQDSVLAHAIVPAIQAHARRRAWDQIDMRSFTSSMDSLFPDGIHPDSSASAQMALEVLRFLRMPRPQITQVGPDLAAPAGWAWQWYFNGDTIPTALGGQSQVLLAAPIGEYRVAVRVDSAFAHILVSEALTIVVSAEPTVANLALTLFPNPAKDVLRWRVSGKGMGNVHLQLYGLTGEALLQTETPARAGELDLRQLPKQTLIVEVRLGDWVERRVLLRQ
jgi:GDSL-like Lipase/Acylhydrolase family